MGNYALREKIRTLFLISMLLALCSCASAYYLYIDSPTTLRLGEEIYFEGSTNTPPPDIIHVVLSQISNIPVEVARISIPIEERGDLTFNGTFDTSGFEAGRYRIEGIADSRRGFSGDSRILRVLTLEDRTGEVALIGQREQWVSDVLKVTGTIRDFKDSSVLFELKKDGETVFGPSSVPVAYGQFDYSIPISVPGTYMLSISDYRGYIGEYQYVLRSEGGETPTPQDEIVRPTVEPTLEPTQTEQDVVITEVPTSVPTEIPIETQQETISTEVETPVPTEIPIETQQEVGSMEVVTPAPLEEPTTIIPTTDAPLLVDETNADFKYDDRLSRAEAGFYIIEASGDTITITTTTGVDWVIEYIDPVTKSKHRVNDADAQQAESARITTDGSPIYVKIYPYSFNEVANITVFGTGIASMGVDNSARIAFGAPPSSDIEENIVHADSASSPNSDSSESNGILSFLFG